MRLALAILAVATGACAFDYSGHWYDDAASVCGATVEWGPQEPDADALCGVLATCPDGADDASIRFADDVAAECATFRFDIGGCYEPFFDTIWLVPAATIEQTALAHELKHRARWLRGEDLDYGHTGPEW